MKSKQCKSCSQSFNKKTSTSLKNWETQTKFCSHACYAESMKGKPVRSTHGRSRTRFYGIWLDMRRRCEKPNRAYYKWYGARGITVCQNWKTFEGFMSEMLESYNEAKKSFLPTIERIDNNGNYEMSNCKWIPIEEQAKNRRNVRHIEYKGRVQTIKEWCDELGLPHERTKLHISSKKWTIEKCLKYQKT